MVSQMGAALPSEYMKKLEAIFQERQRLNLEAVKVMLPGLGFIHDFG